MKRNFIPLSALLLLALSSVFAQTEIRLWPGDAPGSLGMKDGDVPTLTAYLADSASAPTAAMIIFPGGGYSHLAAHEGKDYALFLRAHGIASFVVKYRLGSSGYHHPAMLQDAARAVRLVRHQAAQWKIDPDRVGVMGSSAGGHLASTLLTHFDAGDAGSTDPVDRESSRPTLGVLCYAVISMGPMGHDGSRKQLLGDHPSPELVRDLSNELQVTNQTPPCFLWHTGEDQTVRIENTLAFAAALQQHGVPYDLHVYQKGPHGIGLMDTAPYAHAHPWANDLIYWLQAQGFAAPERH